MWKRFLLQFYGTIKSINTWLLRKTVTNKEWECPVIYLPPMVSFDGAPGYQHHCPELGKWLLQTLVILPISDRGQQWIHIPRWVKFSSQSSCELHNVTGAEITMSPCCILISVTNQIQRCFLDTLHLQFINIKGYIKELTGEKYWTKIVLNWEVKVVKEECWQKIEVYLWDIMEHPSWQIPVPGLVSPNMTLDDNCFLFEEPEVSPAEEASNVPLDGDGSPGLGAAPLIFQLLIKVLLEKYLT